MSGPHELDRANRWCHAGVLPLESEVRAWRDRLSPERRRGFDIRWAEAQREGWADWVRSYQDAAAMGDGCWFDIAQAEYVERFFGMLSFHQGPFAGEPIKLLGWQRNGLLWPVFGWRREDGSRRVRVVYCEIPKKNGKSAISSGVVHYMLCGDGEPGPEVYAAAVDRKQAGIVYDEAARMVDGSAFLQSRCRVIRSTKKIVCEQPSGEFRALSADSESAEGLNVHACIMDELHAHKNRHLYDVMRYGGVARRQSLFWVITTAGEYNEQSIGWQEHTAAERVFSDDMEDWTYHALMFCADEKRDDWTDLRVWRRVNPSVDRVLKESEFQEQIQAALRTPSLVNNIKRRRLNMWVQNAEAWIHDMQRWHALRQDLRFEDLKGRRCYGGLDLSSNEDLTAFALVFPPVVEGEAYTLLSWHWIPKDGIVAHGRANQAPYPQWVQQGWLRTTEGETTDYRQIRREILELLGEVVCEEVCYDPMYASETVTALDDAGVNMVDFRQTIMNFSPAMRSFERLYLSGEIAHDGNPIYSWELGNVTTRRNVNGDIAPDKRLNRRKIDGVVASLMALARGVVAEEAAEPEIYV